MFRVAGTALKPGASALTAGIAAAGWRHCASGVAAARLRIQRATVHTRAVRTGVADPTAPSIEPLSLSQLGPRLAERSTQVLDAGLHIVPTPIGAQGC